MKTGKILTIILCFSVLISCTERTYYSLSELPQNYSLEDAENDGCVVHIDGDVSSGKDIFQKFLSQTEKGEPTNVRLAFYYTLHSENVSKEYYEKNKDKYPKLFIEDLSFDGKVYTLRYIENGKEEERTYNYMKCLPFLPKNIEADYESIKHYVLLDDNTVTDYDTIWKSIASSTEHSIIDHHTVYSEFIR